MKENKRMKDDYIYKPELLVVVLENDDDDESLTRVVWTGVAVLLTDESFEDVKWKGEMVLVIVLV